jgi:3-dehydroquinate synthase
MSNSMKAILPDIEIHSSLADYTVRFSHLDDVNTWQPQADALLIDDFFRNRLERSDDCPVIWIEANEEAKSLPATFDVFTALKQYGLGRGSTLTVIGGGVLQDIGTFVASLYMRGIHWTYVPTTFLGMTDSCLGGKSSINVGPYKNLIGNFYPPQCIDILPVFAKTLPTVEIAGGSAEAAKISFCRGTNAFAHYEQLATPLLVNDWEEEQLAQLLHTTLTIKKWFIEIDEFDNAQRRLLNFGHTWGHALESATSFTIPHGLAVAIGMMASICFTGHQPTTARLWDYCTRLLEPVLHSEQLESFEDDKFLTAFQADKKHSPKNYHLIVPTIDSSSDLGVHEIVLEASPMSLDSVLSAMHESLDALKQIKSSSTSFPSQDK